MWNEEPVKLLQMGREREVAGGKTGLLLWFLDNIIMAAL